MNSDHKPQWERLKELYVNCAKLAEILHKEKEFDQQKHSGRQAELSSRIIKISQKESQGKSTDAELEQLLEDAKNIQKDLLIKYCDILRSKAENYLRTIDHYDISMYFTSPDKHHARVEGDKCILNTRDWKNYAKNLTLDQSIDELRQHVQILSDYCMELEFLDIICSSQWIYKKLLKLYRGIKRIFSPMGSMPPMDSN